MFFSGTAYTLFVLRNADVKFKLHEKLFFKYVLVVKKKDVAE